MKYCVHIIYPIFVPIYIYITIVFNIILPELSRISGQRRDIYTRKVGI